VIFEGLLPAVRKKRNKSKGRFFALSLREFPSVNYREKLPVAVPIPPAPAPTAAITSAPAPATSAALAAAATPPPAAFPLGTCFIHHQRAAEKFLAVQRRDGFFRFRVVSNLGKTETARLTGKTVAQQRQGIRLNAHFRKQRSHLLFRGLERHVPNI
jgi:hypothetical protein